MSWSCLWVKCASLQSQCKTAHLWAKTFWPPALASSGFWLKTSKLAVCYLTLRYWRVCLWFVRLLSIVMQNLFASSVRGSQCFVLENNSFIDTKITWLIILSLRCLCCITLDQKSQHSAVLVYTFRIKWTWNILMSSCTKMSRQPFSQMLRRLCNNRVVLFHLHMFGTVRQHKGATFDRFLRVYSIKMLITWPYVHCNCRAKQVLT